METTFCKMNAIAKVKQNCCIVVTIALELKWCVICVCSTSMRIIRSIESRYFSHIYLTFIIIDLLEVAWLVCTAWTPSRRKMLQSWACYSRWFRRNWCAQYSRNWLGFLWLWDSASTLQTTPSCTMVSINRLKPSNSCHLRTHGVFPPALIWIQGLSIWILPQHCSTDR